METPWSRDQLPVTGLLTVGDGAGVHRDGEGGAGGRGHHPLALLLHHHRRAVLAGARAGQQGGGAGAGDETCNKPQSDL